jgi:hypothetical protein
MNFRMPEPIFIKHGMYNMVIEPISMDYFINPSHQSVCLSMSPHLNARQRFGRNFAEVTNTCNNKRIVGRVILCAVSVLSGEYLWVCLYISFYRC